MSATDFKRIPPAAGLPTLITAELIVQDRGEVAEVVARLDAILGELGFFTLKEERILDSWDEARKIIKARGGKS